MRMESDKVCVYVVSTLGEQAELPPDFQAILLALAIPGLANLWMAVAADVGATLLVTLDDLRLLRLRP